MEFSDKEKSFLTTVSRRKNLYLTFSIASVVVAMILLVYYGLIMKNISGIRLVIVILILLAGKAHLRQYRSAVLLHKVKLWLDSSGYENRNNTQ